MSSVPSLHLISNRNLCPATRFPEIARIAASGGVDAVHVREPDLDFEELVKLVEETGAAITGTGARLIVNRFVDIALRCNADGVHLSEAQLDDTGAIRGSIPDHMILGVSVHSEESAQLAAVAGADYLIAGHVFETGSKPGASGRGLQFIKDVSGAVSIPVIGIGGITPENTVDVLRAGASGVAVMSAVLASPTPESVVSRFRSVLDNTKDHDR